MAGVAVTFPNNGISGTAARMSAVKTLAAGASAVYAYKKSATSNGQGATFWISHDGTTTVSSLSEMIVKWPDRSTQQGCVSPTWAVTVHGPIDYVIDCTNDPNATYTEFT